MLTSESYNSFLHIISFRDSIHAEINWLTNSFFFSAYIFISFSNVYRIYFLLVKKQRFIVAFFCLIFIRTTCGWKYEIPLCFCCILWINFCTYLCFNKGKKCIQKKKIYIRHEEPIRMANGSNSQQQSPAFWKEKHFNVSVYNEVMKNTF